MPTMYRLVSTHALLSGAEVAVTNLSFLSPEDGNLSDVVANFNSHTNAWWNELRVLFPNQTSLARQQLQIFDIETGTVSLTVDLLGVTNPAGNNSNADNLPLEVACCMSLRSGFAGGSARGRIYLPAPGRTRMTESGTFKPEVQTIVTSAFATFFNALKANADGQVVSVIYSVKNRAAIATAAIDVGSVPDAQRRRRNKLVESRVSVTLT